MTNRTAQQIHDDIKSQNWEECFVSYDLCLISETDVNDYITQDLTDELSNMLESGQGDTDRFRELVQIRDAYLD